MSGDFEMLEGVLLKKMLVAQMAITGINMATIEFFKATFEILVAEKGVGCPKMSQSAHVTRQNANRHVRRLEKEGYLDRCNYRAWRLADAGHSLTDNDLLGLLKAAGKAA